MSVVAVTTKLARSELGARRVPRLLAGLAESSQSDLSTFERCYGPIPLPAEAYSSDLHAGRRAASQLISMVERAGLTGRGGAGFPTARKLRSVASASGVAVVVANGGEGEPASHKDEFLLCRVPHLALDGISLAAFAVGADEAYLAVHGQNARLINILDAAIQARNAALIDPVPIQLVGLQDRYVASEQTAIVNWINGGPGLPTFSPRRTHERGVANRPTAVCNVETLAHLALIARYGDAWFREAGVPSAPGTTLVTVSGEIAGPRVYEIELGVTIGDVLTLAGRADERPQAILVGGYFGAWLPTEVAWRTPMSQPGLRAVGGAMGAGILVVLGDSSCGLAETARVVRYLADETAGQCGPCMFGLPALADALTDLGYHGGQGDGVERISRLIPLIEDRGACRHPDGATQLAASSLAVFADDARRHDEHGPCFAVGHPPILPIPGETEY